MSNEGTKDKYIDEYIGFIKAGADQSKILKGTIALGEIGKRTDLSGKVGITSTVATLLGAPTEDIKAAASVCLGNITVGNPQKFIPEILALMDAQPKFKYLLMVSMKEIIVNHSERLGPYLDKIMPLLIDHAKHEDENIRNIVAENIGRLFIFHSG